MRPSFICSEAPQKMFEGACFVVVAFVDGSQTRASVPKLFCASDMRIVPLGSSAEWTATRGSDMSVDHAPFWPAAFENVTETGVAAPVFAAASVAVAPNVCAPFASAVVSTENWYGLDVSG